MQVKADVRQEEKFDFAKLHDEIVELEKRVRVQQNLLGIPVLVSILVYHRCGRYIAFAFQKCAA